MGKRQRIWLPQTGQTTSYAAGDDGYYQVGNPRATRFIDNGNGTITDRATGLTWVQQPELIIPGAVGIDATNQIQSAEGNWTDATPYALADLVADTVDSKFYICVHAHTSDDGSGTDTDAPNTGSDYWRETVWTASAADLTTPVTMSWADAVANSLALEYTGYSDWRLPNAGEIGSTIDYGSAAPTIWSAFPNTVNASYWSGTTPAAVGSGTAIRVAYNVAQLNAAGKASLFYVRPVRGGQLNANR